MIFSVMCHKYHGKQLQCMIITMFVGRFGNLYFLRFLIDTHPLDMCGSGEIQYLRSLSNIKVEVKSVCKQTVCLHFALLYFLKYDVLSEYLTPFWFAMLLNEYEIKFMFRKIRNIRNLGNVYIRGSSHCYEQNRCVERT
jgi:hypothetical protein